MDQVQVPVEPAAIPQAVPQKRRFRADAVLAAFVVALATAFLVALAMLLLKTISIPLLQLDKRLFADLTINLLILFAFALFVLLKGSALATWLLYRHDITWGYKIEKKRVVPIFILAVVMAGAIYSSIYVFATREIEQSIYFSQIGHPIDTLRSVR